MITIFKVIEKYAKNRMKLVCQVSANIVFGFPVKCVQCHLFFYFIKGKFLTA